MDRRHIQEAFTIVKPLCHSLIKYPSVEAARNIANAVPKISNKIIQELLEYILFPFITHLQNETLSKDVKEELVRTMEVIISRIWISKLEYFKKIHHCLLIQIYDKMQPNMVIKEHEELKEAVLSCLKVLIHACFTEVIESLYTRQNASKIGEGILLSITIGRFEKSQVLRIKAVETVMALCQIDNETDRSDVILQDQVADVIMLFLPGIASGLQEIAIGSEIQGYKLTMLALKAWGRVISLVMKDKLEEDDTVTIESILNINNNKQVNPIQSFQTLKDRNKLEEHLRSATRNKEWFTASATKLNILIEQLSVLKTHSHYKVRKELTDTVHLLLSTCSRNMKPNVTTLIEYLISLSEDEYPEVRDKAEKALESINKDYMQNKNMRPLVELLEDSFYNLLTELPRIIRKSDDDDQLSCLNQVAGYLKLLGRQGLSRIMISAPHVNRLLLALVYMSEIDYSQISLLQTINVKDLENSAYSYGSHLWRRFNFINSDFCEAKIIAICKYLAEFGDFRILTDNILGLLHISQHRNELILLLNWILKVSPKDASTLPVYKQIVDLYISPELWNPPIESSDDVSLKIAKKNVVQCCLLLEGLGSVAQNLGCDYDKFLLKTLYLIIERAGSGHSLISYVGTKTLEQIAKYQNYNTVGDLLRANVDYFSYHVSMKLRRVERHPEVLDVVVVVMKYSSMDALPCLKEIVEDVLVQLNSTFQKKNSYAFLKVFYTFTISLKNLIKPKSVSITETEDTSVESQSSKIINTLLEYYEAKNIDENIENIEFDENDEKIDINEEDNLCQEKSMEEDVETDNIPTHIKMTEDLMKHCLHFLPSKEIQVSLMAMSTLQEGLLILADWENQLLPIVHLLWHPLVDRFQDKNVLIIYRAWQLLTVLSQVSKDFIRSRTLKQVFPALSKFLLESAKESYKKSSTDIYRFTHTYKLQNELLSRLAYVSKYLCLQERDTWTVLSIAEPYLSKRQHPMLQISCVQLYKDITDYNSDLALIKCFSIFNSKIGKISYDATFNIKDITTFENSTKNEYFENVLKIVNYIQDKYSHL